MLLTERQSRYVEMTGDPDWCGHPFVSLRTWTCMREDCERPATSATRALLESQPTVAPPGKLWTLLVSWDNDDAVDEKERVALDGIFTDRTKIPRLMIRGRICGAKDIRETMRRIHWYQGVFAHDIFEGWEEEPDERGCYHRYRLTLVEIDCV